MPGTEKGPRSLGQVIEEALGQPEGMLSGLAARARAQGRLTDHLRAALPARAAGSIVSCALQEDGTVSVSVDSAAWASRLRFEQARLLARARELHPEVRDVQVRVARQGG
jgi:hypothetical protein